jgi:glycosyltransferase involved in cell wall biosynthesis
MTNRSLVSVVIPAYNAEEFIEEAIHSALSQSYGPIEIIVVDDGSTDSTSRRVAAFGDRVIHVHRPNSGGYPGIPRNTGIARASGEYIFFLDADDVMLPDRIHVQADFLRTHPEVGCVFGDYQNFSASDPVGPSHFQTCRRLSEKLRSRSRLILRCEDATALLLRENIGIPSSMAINRKVLSHVPGFPRHLHIGEDFEFSYRIARQFDLGVINSVVVMRRFHGGNISGDSLRTLHDQVVSFSFLRNSEPDARNIERLGDRLHICEIDLARIYANRRQYLRALAYGGRAFRGALPRRPRRILAGLRSLLRTVAIATRLKEPAP